VVRDGRRLRSRTASLRTCGRQPAGATSQRRICSGNMQERVRTRMKGADLWDLPELAAFSSALRTES
jgi:hypothetical protein